MMKHADNRLPRRAFVCLLGLCICALSFSIFALPLSTQAQISSEPSSSIHLVINYGQGVEKHFKQIHWRKGITVLEAMQQAGELPDPLGLHFKVKGRKTTAFVRSIDGLANQGAGKNKRNWIFSVNGTPATQSCGVKAVETGDLVEWRFATYNMGNAGN